MSSPQTQLAAILADWPLWARDDQLPPAATERGEPWRVWLILGGRGAGKTRAGAEWVRAKALGSSPLGEVPRRAHRARRRDDGRRAPRDDRGRVGPARRARGARAPALRALEAAARLALGRDRADVLGREPGRPARAAVRCRLVRRARQVAPAASGPGTCCSSRCGSAQHPQMVVTTTPRPIPLLKKLIADAGDGGDARRDRGQRRQPGADVRRRDDAALCRHRARAPGIAGRARRRHRRARCGGATGSRRTRVAAAPELRRIVVAVDPPVTATAALGRVRHRRRRARPRRARLRARRPHAAGPRAAVWARAAIAAYRDYLADRVVAEVNQGGDLVVARAAPDRSERGRAHGARDARQVAARRAGRRALRGGARRARRHVRRARGPDVRVRRRRARRGTQPRPARRAGVGLDRFDDRRRGARRACACFSRESRPLTSSAAKRSWRASPPRGDAKSKRCRSPRCRLASPFERSGWRCTSIKGTRMSRMLDAMSRLLPRPRASARRQGERRRAADRLGPAGPAGVEPARLRGLRARRLHAERHRLSLRAHDRGGRGVGAAAALRGRGGDRRASAARSHRAALARPHERRFPRELVRLPARRRQRLRRGGGARRAPARAARAAPRPHEGDPGPRRLAGGLRVHGGRTHGALRRRSRSPACARSCTCACSTPSTTTTA